MNTKLNVAVPRIIAADLQAQLDSGKTLAELAWDKGVSQHQLFLILMAHHKEQLDIMVKSGYMTQEQANSSLQRVRERIQPNLNQSQRSTFRIRESSARGNGRIRRCYHRRKWGEE